MDLSFGQVIVIIIAVAAVVHLVMSHQRERRKLEIIHQERLVAIEKGVPLPELPLEPPSAATGHPSWDTGPLFIGVTLGTLGLGTMAAFMLTRDLSDYMFLPLPFVFMGVGLSLYYFLTRRRK
jgi:hypothetical protein